MKKITFLFMCLFGFIATIQAQTVQSTTSIDALLKKYSQNESFSTVNFTAEERQILSNHFAKKSNSVTYSTQAAPSCEAYVAECLQQQQQRLGQVTMATSSFNGTSYNNYNNELVDLAYESGPYFNIPGNPDISRLENVTLGMTTTGFGAQVTAGNRMADDIILTDDYDITTIDFYAYQTGTPTSPASINEINLQVWDGDPSNPASTVIWGDPTTNVFSSAVWSNAYREAESAPGTTRAIQRVTVAPVGLSLPAGTYWLDWSFGGTGASGPWQPPVAILGQTMTGNGMQFTTASGVWGPAQDGGTLTQQGLPIQVYGDCTSCSSGSCAAATFTSRTDFEAAFSGTLNLEDFAGGPAAITGCDGPFSAAGNSCYAAGEILPGISITTNTPTNPDPMVFAPAGFASNVDDVVGSNQFTSFTIINFPNNDVNSFGFDLHSLVSGSNVDVRVFGASGLIETVTVDVTSTGPVFFGYIAAETVVSVELEDLSGGNVELIAQLAFGQCGGTTPPVCTSTQYDAVGLPFAIDGAGTTTADCAGAPNLVPVAVADAGVIGTDANIENVSIDITHTWAGDLVISLVSPTGTELILSDGNGGSADNYTGTVFEDGGADITAATAPFTGTFAPEGGTFAATFAGESITGDWQLKICDTASGDSGTVDSFTLSICVPEVVTNDECDDAIALACGDTYVGETVSDTDSGGNPAPDEFFSYTGSGSPEIVTLSLCGGGTDYDSLLRVFTDCTLGTEIATNDDACGLQSELSFLSNGTSTYFIMVEGFGSSAGNFSLVVSCTIPPVNDECTGALPITCGETILGSTNDATVDAGAPSCGQSITAPGVWYVFEDTSGLLTDYTVSLCDGGTSFDSKLTVWSGDCGVLTCVGDNDDECGLQSEVTFQGDGSTTYYILVHGFGGATGDFSLNLSCAPVPPPNDLIANSIDVDEIGFPYTDPSVAMPAATTEAGNPSGCNINGANGVWYNFTPEGDGTATASITTPGGISSVTFYTAPDESSIETDLVLVPEITNECNPGTSAAITTTAGQAYYVFVVNSGSVTDIVIDGTNLGLGDNTIEGFSFYPNPSNETLNLLSIDNIESVAIYNILGQKVIDQNIEATSTQLNVAGLSTGTYIMKVSVNGQLGTYKIIKR